MLLSDECVLEAVEKLTEKDFYQKSHQLIFRAMYDLASLSKPIDLVTVTERMELSGKLSIEELTYLSDLTGRVPSTQNLSYYIEIVEEKSLLRRLIHACGDIADIAFKAELSAGDALSRAGDLIYKIADDKGTHSLEHIKGALFDSYDMILKAKKSGKGIIGIPTGFPMMDNLLSGFQPSQLIIIAGRPGMGKTSFAMNIVEHITLQEKRPAAVFSLEMSRDQLAMRILCAQAQVDSRKARTGALTDADCYSLTDAMQPISEAPIYIDDTPAIGVTEMMAKVRRLRQQVGDVAVVVIDYLQLMSLGGRVENRQQEISQITRSIKIMARDLSVPVVLLSQLSRASEKRENKMPMLSDLRESGAIEQDADVVLFLHREDYYQGAEDGNGESFIKIAKQRNGPTGKIKVQWVGEQTKYKEVDFEHEE